MRKGKELLAVLLLAATFVLYFAACSVASVVSETGGQFIRIILETRSDKVHANGGEWKGVWNWEAQGDGAVEEASLYEYFGAAEKELSKLSSQDKDGIVIIPDGPVPGGKVEFYFKGGRPGMVELFITCSYSDRRAPLAEARFKLSVSTDLKIDVLESSEKYDWGDL